MSAVSAWIMCILGVIILGVLFDLLLHGSKMHKMIQTVFATATILVVITPVPGLIKSGFGARGDNIFNMNISLDEKYLDYVDSVKLAAIEKGVADALAADGFTNVEVKVAACFDVEIVITSVRINLKNLVIEKNYLHINKYEYVKDKVSEYLKISKDVIVVYE